MRPGRADLVVDGRISWQPDGAPVPLTFDVKALFVAGGRTSS